MKKGELFKEALRLRYQAEIAEAKATLEVYFTDAVGIGEHSDLITEYDKYLQKLTDAEDKLATLEKYYGNAEKSVM